MQTLRHVMARSLEAIGHLADVVGARPDPDGQLALPIRAEVFPVVLKLHAAIISESLTGCQQGVAFRVFRVKVTTARLLQ